MLSDAERFSVTQAALFDHQDAPESLPYQGRTTEAIVAGRDAADHAAQRRGRLAMRYLDALLRAGAEGLTDHEAAQRLTCPVSSVCSTRAGATVRDQIAPHGHRRGPYGEANTVYVLRLVVDQPIGSRETSA